GSQSGHTSVHLFHPPVYVMHQSRWSVPRTTTPLLRYRVTPIEPGESLGETLPFPSCRQPSPDSSSRYTFQSVPMMTSCSGIAVCPSLSNHASFVPQRTAPGWP